MKALLILFCLTTTFLFNCAAQDGCDGSVNKLPMYGNVKKCRELIEADKQFISEADKNFTSRKGASNYYAQRGWDYMREQKLDTAMMRFNQAWLLDSLNANTYWGFADLLGMQHKYNESLPMFDRALKLTPAEPRLLMDASTSYGNLFVQSKNMAYLNKSINLLKTAARLTPDNPAVYAQLTAAYSFQAKRDSAMKYLHITDKIDKNAVNPELRKWLMGH